MKRALIGALLALAVAVPTAVIAQTARWHIRDAHVDVGDTETIFVAEEVRSSNIGEIRWFTDDNETLVIWQSINGGGWGHQFTVNGEDIDCPGLRVEYVTDTGHEYNESRVTVPNGCIPAGEYTLSVAAGNIEGGDGSNTFGPISYTAPGGPPPAIEYTPADVTRLAGGSRYETAVEVSRFQFPNRASRVTLANASVQVDALPGSQLGGGPILYVPAEGLVPAVVLEEVARLNPTEIIVLGGQFAVSDEVVEQVVAQTSHRVN